LDNPLFPRQLSSRAKQGICSCAAVLIKSSAVRLAQVDTPSSYRE